jgi:hypothetical protein
MRSFVGHSLMIGVLRISPFFIPKGYTACPFSTNKAVAIKLYLSALGVAPRINVMGVFILQSYYKK